MNNKMLNIITLCILLFMLAGCVSFDEGQVSEKTDEIAEKIIQENPNQDELEVSGRNAEPDAVRSILNLSGRNFDGFGLNDAFGDEMSILNLISPGLTRYDPDSMRFLPVLAESWEISDDLLTWTFTLRDDIAWVVVDTTNQEVRQVTDSDGEVIFLSANDIKNQLLYTLAPGSGSDFSYLLFNIVGAQEYASGTGGEEGVQIEVPSEDRLVIHLKEPDAGLLDLTELNLFSAFPTWLDQGDSTGRSYFYGPFIPASALTIDNDELILVKNPYWPGTEGLAMPSMDMINITIQNSLDVLETFRVGALDAVLLTDTEYEIALADPELADSIVSVPGRVGLYMLFNNTDLEPLNDVNVRRSIAGSLDRSSLMDSLEKGEWIVQEGFIPDYLRKEPFDGASYSSNANSSTADFNMAGIDLISYGLSTKISNAIYFQLSEKSKLNFFPHFVSNSGTDESSLYTELNQNYSDSPGIYMLHFSLNENSQQEMWDSLYDPMTFVEIQNGNWNNSEFTDLFNQAKQATNPEDRIDLYARMEEILVNEDVMIIPIFWAQEHWLVSQDLNAEILPLYQQYENWSHIAP